MSSNQLTITVNVPDDTAKEDAFATADSVMDAVMTVDGVDTVGASVGRFQQHGRHGRQQCRRRQHHVYLLRPCWATKAPKAKAVEQEIYGKTADLNCEN